MTEQVSQAEFLRNLSDSQLLSGDEVSTVLARDAISESADSIVHSLVSAGKLTPFQAEAVKQRRFSDLTIGNYVILARLGAGGMGTVYKAQHRRMKRVVAIKVLAKQVATSETFLQRFQREVEAVARLSHPNIVMAFDADEAEAGHFLVMEYIDGQDLDSYVRERGPCSAAAAAVDCVIQAAKALSYAHAQGIIHRDIKPANLLRDLAGVVKVADLGLARFSNSLAGPVAETGGITQAGTIMGTVDYMPPEQAMGLANTDHRADIYSLGCTLYFLLTGQPLYPGTTLIDILIKHREAPIPSLRDRCPEAPPGLDDVLRRMVAKQPDERYASMQEVIEALVALNLTAPVAGSLSASRAGEAQDSGRTLVFDASSQPGSGTTTEFTAGAQTVDLGTAPAKRDAALSVLLVELSRTQIGIIRKYLQELGVENIAAATSGKEALELARTISPGVIISAMHLPDMTGVALARQARAEATLAGTGFVLITSKADHDNDDAANHVEGMVLLTKPFDAAQLSRAMSQAAAERSRPGGSAAPRSAASLKVLVADDSSAARIQVRGVLTALGVRNIVEVQDGAEAQARLEKEAFDLVVTDYNMPRLDGRGLIDFIRHHSSNPAVPVILVTTETDPAKLDAVRQLGVSAMCDKSFKLEVVHAVMEKLR